MIRRILWVVIGKHCALHQHKMVERIHYSGVDATLVGAFVKHPAIVVLLQRCLLEEGAQHILVLHLAHAENAKRTVLRHGQDGLVHVVALTIGTGFRPMLHTVLSEGIVGLGAVHIRVEEVLHVPEGHADWFVLP